MTVFVTIVRVLLLPVCAAVVANDNPIVVPEIEII